MFESGDPHQHDMAETPDPRGVNLQNSSPADRAPARSQEAAEAVPSGDQPNSYSTMRMLMNAVERAPDVILITEAEPVDEPGPRIVYVNPAFERMTGYTSADILGRTPRILQGPKSDRAALDRIRKALKAWKPVREELVNYRKDGSEFDVEISIVPLADERGWYTHWMAIQRETTEQNAMRARLQKSESRLRVLSEAIPQLLWTANAKGDCEYISSACAEFLGMSGSHALSRGWAEFIHPDERSSVQLKWREAIAHGCTFVAEYRLRRHDGRYLWFLNRAAPRLNDQGAVVEWIGTSTDIVVQKHSEEALRQAEKLAAVGRLASSISHEINNPLEGLTNLLYLLQGESSLSEQGRAYLASAQEQLARVSEVTTQALRFHRQSTQAAMVIVPDMLDTLLAIHRTQIDSREIQVRRRYRDNPVLECFVGEIRQAIANVLGNAMDAVPPQGHISVSVRAAASLSADGAKGVRITIVDSGRGIPVHDRQHLFQAFFSTKGVSGTGLGLWLAREIVERHQGTISVRSSVRAFRSGTAVSIFLPSRKALPPFAQPERGASLI